MIELLLLITCNSLLIVGFYKSTLYDGWEGDEITPSGNDDHEWRMILWWVRYYGLALPMWIQKPLFRCPVCMASIHGIIPYTLLIFEMGLPEWYMMLLPFYTLALAGMNVVIFKLTDE